MRTNPNHPSVFDSILYAYDSFVKKYPEVLDKQKNSKDFRVSEKKK